MMPHTVAAVVQQALAEDLPWGDATVGAAVPPDATFYARLTARESGCFAGGAVFTEAFRQVDSTVEVTNLVAEGTRFTAGDVLGTVTGPAAGILTAERVALNFVQRLSGVATLTAQYVAAVAETGSTARIADTRKTTPGLRALEKHAVVAGGGVNHRFGLSDAIIVEVDHIHQIAPVLTAGVTGILLDNFTLEDLRLGVEMIAGQCVVEASGGVRLDTVAEIAQTGVDIISVGALTHGAAALDLGLDAA